MANEAWTEDELFEGVTPSPAFVSELERLGLLIVVGRDARGGALYSPEARDELEKVLGLVELGYQLEDIAAIATRVGLPVRRRRALRKVPLHLSALEVAQRAQVSPEFLERLIDAGLISPSLRGEGPRALFTLAILQRVERLRDLMLLGVSEAELTTWSVTLDALDSRRQSKALSTDEAHAVDGALDALAERLDSLSHTTRRWKRLITTLKRRLTKRRPSDEKPLRSKRRLRTRTRR